MAARQFSRFPALPTEVQLLIWSFAASPKGTLELRKEFLYQIENTLRGWFTARAQTSLKQAFFRATSQWMLHMCVDPSDPSVRVDERDEERVLLWIRAKENIRTIARARIRLLGTCRLSRQVVLDAWKKDVEAIDLEADDGSGRDIEGVESSKEVLGFRDRIVGGLGGLIRDLKRGDEQRA